MEQSADPGKDQTDQKNDVVEPKDQTLEIISQMQELIKNLDSKKKDLIVLDERLDRKISDFKKVVEMDLVSGRSIGGQPQKTPQDQETDRLKQIFKNVGVELPI